jgi:uncharacterized Ntn-hydrolase superfamily protein
MLVVAGEATGRVWEETLVDLRIEDHPDPIAELTRLLNVSRGYDKMNEGDLAVEHGDMEAAEAAYSEAQRILGDNLEASYWAAVALCNAGEHDRAIAIFHRVFEAGESWHRLTPRLIEGGYLIADEALLARILKRGDQ